MGDVGEGFHVSFLLEQTSQNRVFVFFHDQLVENCLEFVDFGLSFTFSENQESVFNECLTPCLEVVDIFKFSGDGGGFLKKFVVMVDIFGVEGRCIKIFKLELELFKIFKVKLNIDVASIFLVSQETNEGLENLDHVLFIRVILDISLESQVDFFDKFLSNEICGKFVGFFSFLGSSGGVLYGLGLFVL